MADVERETVDQSAQLISSEQRIADDRPRTARLFRAEEMLWVPLPHESVALVNAYPSQILPLFGPVLTKEGA